MTRDIRWIQRFENFGRALDLLAEGASGAPEELSRLEKEGLVQRFEYSFELAWKTMKDYLQHSGVDLTPATARSVIKEAFAAKMISEGDTWISMLDHRNLLSHTYDQMVFEKAVGDIAHIYLPAMQALHAFFEKEQ